MFSQRYINIKSKFIDLTYSFVSEELYHLKKIFNLHSKSFETSQQAGIQELIPIYIIIYLNGVIFLIKRYSTSKNIDDINILYEAVYPLFNIGGVEGKKINNKT